jgi:hypothetical protein
LEIGVDFGVGAEVEVLFGDEVHSLWEVGSPFSGVWWEMWVYV